MREINLILVEDNRRLRAGLLQGLELTGRVCVVYDCESGEECLQFMLAGNDADAVLMDVALAGQLDGIATTVELRREFPRFPTVFYSIQDDDAYFRAFRDSGILSHYAYVRKSNYLLPEMIVPLLDDAISGRGFIDPDIETRVQEVRHHDQYAPLHLLEPNERIVACMIAAGMTNEQIASQMGFKDKRTISRTAGQIYATWGLAETTTDMKIARTRAAIIVQIGKLLTWDASGVAFDADGNRHQWESSG